MALFKIQKTVLVLNVVAVPFITVLFFGTPLSSVCILVVDHISGGGSRAEGLRVVMYDTALADRLN